MKALRHLLNSIREREGGDGVRRFADVADTSVDALLFVARGDRGAGPRMMRGIRRASSAFGEPIEYETMIEENPNIDRPRSGGGSKLTARGRRTSA